MNLQGITASAVAAVNPRTQVAYQESIGYVTAADGSQQPAYKAAQPALAQIQPLTFTDLKQLEGVNMNGERRAVYLRGNAQGVVRPRGKGGDLIAEMNGNVWLVVQSLEQWPDWCKVAVTLQNGS